MTRKSRRHSKKTRANSMHARAAPHSMRTHINRNDNWVGAPLLNAMDTMEGHVQEMLDHGRHPVQPTAPNAALTLDNTTVNAQIVCEVKRRMEDKLTDIVDTAAATRIEQLQDSRKVDQTNNGALQTARTPDCPKIHELDVLHRHEHVLNTALVERLFQAQALEGDPAVRFEETTFSLQGTDSVSSVLVSHVEALVIKVEMLERRVEWLEESLESKGV